MQCFQKDPNLRVSAKKLLKHAWIVGSRRTDAPIAKQPANFNEAVEEVKQWNEALRSPTGGTFRVSARSNVASPMPPRREPPLRANDPQPTNLITPMRGPLSLAKPKNPAEAFRSPESTGDDNWDDDFATSISPSALHLPQFKPHDNFGGLLSSDRLKAFASFDIPNDENDNWDNNFEGDLMTIKSSNTITEPDSHELETIRPYRIKPTIITQDLKPAVAPKGPGRKASLTGPARPRSPVKAQVDTKFVLPSRPAARYREHSVEDYSDLFVENDSFFDRRLNIIKVGVLFFLMHLCD
jgi:hypothetical protein